MEIYMIRLHSYFCLHYYYCCRGRVSSAGRTPRPLNGQLRNSVWFPDWGQIMLSFQRAFSALAITEPPIHWA
jgi:hypothetical protein